MKLITTLAFGVGTISTLSAQILQVGVDNAQALGLSSYTDSNSETVYLVPQPTQATWDAALNGPRNDIGVVYTDLLPSSLGVTGANQWISGNFDVSSWAGLAQGSLVVTMENVRTSSVNDNDRWAAGEHAVSNGVWSYGGTMASYSQIAHGANLGGTQFMNEDYPSQVAGESLTGSSVAMDGILVPDGAVYDFINTNTGLIDVSTGAYLPAGENFLDEVKYAVNDDLSVSASQDQYAVQYIGNEYDLQVNGESGGDDNPFIWYSTDEASTFEVFSTNTSLYNPGTDLYNRNNNNYTVKIGIVSSAMVPEPSSVTLLGLSVFGMIVRRRR